MQVKNIWIQQDKKKHKATLRSKYCRFKTSKWKEGFIFPLVFPFINWFSWNKIDYLLNDLKGFFCWIINFNSLHLFKSFMVCLSVQSFLLRLTMIYFCIQVQSGQAFRWFPALRAEKLSTYCILYEYFMHSMWIICHIQYCMLVICTGLDNDSQYAM